MIATTRILYCSFAKGRKDDVDDEKTHVCHRNNHVISPSPSCLCFYFPSFICVFVSSSMSSMGRNDDPNGTLCISDPRVSAANVTLDFSHQPTKYNYQTYSFLVNGLIPGNSGNGYFSEAACAWKRPPAFAYRYFVHTHLYGVLVEGYLIRNDSWTLIGSQLSMGKKKDFYDLPGKPVEIKPGDILAARCLYINAEEKPVKFGMSEGEEMCNFQLDLGYDPQYDEQFRRPPVCRAISPDFTFCDNPETNQLC